MTPELLNVDPWARRDKNCKRVPAMKSGYCRPEVDLESRAGQIADFFIALAIVVVLLVIAGIIVILASL